MLARIVDWSLDNRPLVLILATLVVLAGALALTQLPIDAVPDVTNVQVQVLTKAPALGPAEMEQWEHLLISIQPIPAMNIESSSLPFIIPIPGIPNGWR